MHTTRSTIWEKRQHDTVTVTTCFPPPSSAFLLPEDVVSLYVGFPSWPFFLWSGQPSGVNPIAQLGVIPQHNTAIAKWPRSKPAPILWCCPHLASPWVPSSDSTDPGNDWRRQLSPVGQVANTHKHVRTETFWTQTDFNRNCIDLVNSVLSHYCFSSVCPSYN